MSTGAPPRWGVRSRGGKGAGGIFCAATGEGPRAMKHALRARWSGPPRKPCRNVYASATVAKAEGCANATLPNPLGGLGSGET